MKPARRLIETNARFERLVAGDDREQPRPEVLDDLLQKLALIDAGAPTTTARSARWLWVPIAVCGVSILAGLVALVPLRTDRAAATPVSSVPAPSSVAPLRQDQPAAPEESDKRQEKAVNIADLPSVPASAGRPKKLAPSGRRELELVIAAREALTRHESEGCLAIVDDYESEFPRGQFALEVKVMRIEATLARGDRERSRALARDFIEKNPSSFYTDRVRSLLGSLETK